MPAELLFESREEDSESARIDDAVDRKGTRKKKELGGDMIHQDEAAFYASDNVQNWNFRLSYCAWLTVSVSPDLKFTFFTGG